MAWIIERLSIIHGCGQAKVLEGGGGGGGGGVNTEY